MKIQGPIEVEVKVMIVNPDEQVRGEVTIGMGRGTYPTDEDIRDRVRVFVEDEMPKGYRLMTKREYWDAICGDQFGEQFAMPGGPDYDT